MQLKNLRKAGRSLVGAEVWSVNTLTHREQGESPKEKHSAVRVYQWNQQSRDQSAQEEIQIIKQFPKDCKIIMIKTVTH